jgi:predicted acetyltransferase
MPALADPDVRVHASFLRAMDAFVAEGRGGPADLSMIGRDLREWGSRWQDPQVFAAYVDAVRAQRLEETPRPSTFVPTTTLWWVEGQEYLGRVQLRHRLTDPLLQEGGHIGYDVAPAHRRKGHATAMLRAMLPRCARDHGLERVLITCDSDNVASRKVIEACGGVFEDQRRGKLRYWVPTTS